MNRSYFDIVKKPIVSEKYEALKELQRVYAFEVATFAKKQEIKQAIEKLFKTKVASVRTVVMHGKCKRVGRSAVKRSNWKKAFVTLKEGQKIEFLPSV